MVKNSTLMLIVDEIDGKSEIVDIDDLFDPNGAYNKELDEIFSLFDYSPSDKVISQILEHPGLK